MRVFSCLERALGRLDLLRGTSPNPGAATIAYTGSRQPDGPPASVVLGVEVPDRVAGTAGGLDDYLHLRALGALGDDHGELAGARHREMGTCLAAEGHRFDAGEVAAFDRDLGAALVTARAGRDGRDVRGVGVQVAGPVAGSPGRLDDDLHRLALGAPGGGDGECAGARYREVGAYLAAEGQRLDAGEVAALDRDLRPAVPGAMRRRDGGNMRRARRLVVRVLVSGTNRGEGAVLDRHPQIHGAAGSTGKVIESAARTAVKAPFSTDTRRSTVPPARPARLSCTRWRCRTG